jgi:hypothetical protein
MCPFSYAEILVARKPGEGLRLNHANMMIVIADLKGGKIILFYHGAF